MRLQLHHLAVCTIIFVFLFGCSKYFTTTKKTTNVTSNADIRPRQNLHYVIYYSNELGIHEFNTRTNADNSIFCYPSNSSERQWKISPDKTKIALTYIDNLSEKTSLTILDLISLKSWHLKKIPKNYYYSFEWSPDSKELCVGYFSYKHNGYSLHKGDIFIASYNGNTIRSIGCIVSKYVNHWLPNGTLIVGDDNHLYGVNRQNCSTIFSLTQLSPKKAITKIS